MIDTVNMYINKFKILKYSQSSTAGRERGLDTTRFSDRIGMGPLWFLSDWATTLLNRSCLGLARRTRASWPSIAQYLLPYRHWSRECGKNEKKNFTMSNPMRHTPSSFVSTFLSSSHHRQASLGRALGDAIGSARSDPMHVLSRIQIRVIHIVGSTMLIETIPPHA